MNKIISLSALIFMLSSFNTERSWGTDPFTCELPDNTVFKPLENLKIRQFTLKNGLRLLVVPDHSSPFFTMRLVYAAGSRDESPGQTGYAHLVEHLMFKGSEEIADGAYMSAIEFAGGRANASTDYDRTDFWAELPSNYLEQALWLEADRMKGLVLDRKKINNQRQAVLEEKAMRLTNQPYLNIVSHFIIKLWQKTPYGHLIIGTDKDLNAANKQKMESWLADWYHPANAVLAITGDVDPEKAFILLKKYFAHLPAGKKRQEISDQTIPSKAITQTLYDSMAPWPIHALAWNTPGFAHKDSAAIRVVNDLLFQKPDGIIYRTLLEKQRLAIAIEHLDYGFQYIALANAIIVPHSYASRTRIRKSIDSSLKSLRLHGFTSSQLCRAINTRVTNTLSAYQRPLSLITLLSDDLMVHNDALYSVKNMKQLLQLTPEAAQQMLLKYFNNNYILITVSPGWLTRFIKTLSEWLPDSLGQYFEDKFL